jgi:hypothetical protein
MAGVKGRSGGANGGPQYNPANVSATGGNGQSGQAKPGYTGFAYGENKSLDTQAGGAKMAQAAQPQGAAAPDMSMIQGLLSGVTPLDADPTDPTIPVSNGVNVGRGAGEESLPAQYKSDRRQVENLDLIKQYMPDLINAARVQNAPDSYKQFINYLKSQVI